MTIEEFSKWGFNGRNCGGRNQEKSDLSDGDKNSKFCHKMDNQHSRRNFLVKVRVNGDWLSEKAEIKDGVSRAFQTCRDQSTLYKKAGKWTNLHSFNPNTTG